MCRHRSKRFDANLTSVPAARSFLRDALEDWRLVQPVETATLLASELVTNAIVHARTPLELAVDVSGKHLEVAVGDGDVRVPPPPEPDAERVRWESEGGRGLSLLSTLADDWGISQQPEGKQVWFRLDTGPLAWDDDCACVPDPHGEHAHRPHLASSGTLVVDRGPGWAPGHAHDGVAHRH